MSGGSRCPSAGDEELRVGKGDVVLFFFGCFAIYVVAWVALSTAVAARGHPFLKTFRLYLALALGTLTVSFLASLTFWGSTHASFAGYAAGASIVLLFAHMAIAAAFSRVERQS